MSNILMRLDVYSHNIKISNFDNNIKNKIIEYCLSLGEIELIKKSRWDKNHFRSVIYYEKVLKRIYASATADRSEFRIHINCLNDFIKQMSFNGIYKDNIEFIYHEFKEPLKIDLNFIDKRIPREEDQQIAINYLTDEGKTKVLTLQTGAGKAQPLDAKIKIPNGWTTMGDLKIGETISSHDGSLCVVTGIYPQGKKEIYKVTFADGRSTECCGEHLWKVFYVNTSKNLRWRVVNTLEIIRYLKMPNPRIYIPLIIPHLGSYKNLPIDPYLLGVILGDGSTRNSNVTITKTNYELFDKLKLILPRDLKFSDVNHNTKRIVTIETRNSLVKHLKDLNLLNKLSYEKFIPNIYFESSIEQRLELLNGLLDTDGTVAKNGHISFCSTSEALAKGVQYLVRSIGGIAYISEKISRYTYNGKKHNGRKAYTVSIRHPKPSILFTLSKKRDRINDDNQYSKKLKLRIKSVELIGEKESQCITVSHPDRLYITDDFIVTHNTLMFNHAFNIIRERVAIIIKGMYVQRWLDDLQVTYKFNKHDIMVVRGSKDLITLIELAKNNLLDAKVIIITNTTFRMFIDEYEVRKSNNMYGCNPEDFFNLINVGIRLIDEVHQDFHLNFKIDLYTNVKKTISLSATLQSDNKFLNRMYEIMFPLLERPKDFGYDKYIVVDAYIYHLLDVNKVKYKQRGRASYSHVAFEESIMRQEKIFKRYKEMIVDIIQTTFVPEWKPGQKMLIFCATVDMCTRLTQYLKNMFIEFDVTRYVGEDDYSVVERNNIIVSTLKSAGTAVDIPGLKTTLMTVAVGSRQANEQAVGRLRKLKQWPEESPKFIYLVCADIPSHLEYHRHKKDVLSDKILSLKEFNTPYKI